MRVLLVCDRRDWAYDSIAQALTRHNSDPEISLDTAYMKDEPKKLLAAINETDLVFVMGWQSLKSRNRLGFVRNNPLFDHSKIITGIHSHHAWDRRKTQPNLSVPPPKSLIRFLKRFHGVNVVSKRLFDLFRAQGLPQLCYTPNGVDSNCFRPIKPVGRKNQLVVGYSGSLAHDWRKGITDYIEPACRKARVCLKKAMPTEGHHVPNDQMPGFYNGIDVYLCASSSEGFSLSVLEAAACGRPIISTNVGGCEELIRNGENGFLVERDVDAIVEKLLFFKGHRDALRSMGEAARDIIETDWGWEQRAPGWINFIRSAYQAKLSIRD